MYNLFVSGNDEAWHGEPFEIELSRCVREYTAPDISERYGSLDRQAVAALKRLPCLFAYEAVHELPPQFGRIVDVTRRHNDVRVEYRLEPVNPFLTHDDLTGMTFELEIGKMEMNRTHWAVKEVNLVRELARKGIPLPSWAQRSRINISTHQFDVALSFPGGGSLSNRSRPSWSTTWVPIAASTTVTMPATWLAREWMSFCRGSIAKDRG